VGVPLREEEGSPLSANSIEVQVLSRIAHVDIPSRRRAMGTHVFSPEKKQKKVAIGGKKSGLFGNLTVT